MLRETSQWSSIGARRSHLHSVRMSACVALGRCVSFRPPRRSRPPVKPPHLFFARTRATFLKATHRTFPFPPMRRIPAVHTRGGNTTASRRCVSGAYVRWRGSHRAWRRAPSSLRSSSRARGGSDAPGETRRFTHGSIDDDDEHMDGMDDDPSRELEDEDDDDESDDREAFKREQDLQYSMTAIRQKHPRLARGEQGGNFGTVGSRRRQYIGVIQRRRWVPDEQTKATERASGTGPRFSPRARRIIIGREIITPESRTAPTGVRQRRVRRGHRARHPGVGITPRGSLDVPGGYRGGGQVQQHVARGARTVHGGFSNCLSGAFIFYFHHTGN